VTGAQFAVDYGPNLEWVADIQLYPAYIGNTPAGYSVGFGVQPQTGAKFQIVQSICIWTNDCSVGQNVDGPVVVEHPLFPDPCPIVTRFPDQAVLEVFGARSSTCSCDEIPTQVALDIKPGSCPNPLNVKVFEKNPGSMRGGVLPVAVLGTMDFDVTEIDVSTLHLEGVTPIRHNYEDVSTPVGDGEECVCTTAGPDGYMDLTLKFMKSEIVAALGQVSNGDVVVLTLTGQLLDGTELIDATDCVWIRGDLGGPQPHLPYEEVDFGRAFPNPFNPVTQISYRLPTEEFVQLSVYDVTGRLIDQLVSGMQPAGEHVVEWNAKGLSSGIYFYRIQIGNLSETRKLILLK
jgi:hypothetical protein